VLALGQYNDKNDQRTSFIAIWRLKMKYEVYQDKKQEYRWRLRHSNGNILSKSSESYKAKDDCMRCIDTNKNSSNAITVEL
jgi:uncharacterized protein